MSRRRRQGLSPSLFPFLAVLVCTLGTLILLLALVAQNAASAAASEQQASAAVKNSTPRLSAAHVQSLMDEADFRVVQLVAIRHEQVADIEDRRDQLTHLDDHMLRIRDEMKRLNDEVKMATGRTPVASIDQEQLAKLKSQIEIEATRVTELREGQKNQTPRVIIVPHKGPNGTDRRPVYLECTSNGLTIWPEGTHLAEMYLKDSVGDANPLDAALRVIRNHAMQNYGDSVAPYPLLVVRPDGIETYASARHAMRDWDDQFGYELVPADVELAHAAPDPALRKKVDYAIRQAIIKQNGIQRLAARLSGGGPVVPGSRRYPTLSAASMDRQGRASGYRDHRDGYTRSNPYAPSGNSPRYGDLSDGAGTGADAASMLQQQLQDARGEIGGGEFPNDSARFSGHRDRSGGAHGREDLASDSLGASTDEFGEHEAASTSVGSGLPERDASSGDSQGESVADGNGAQTDLQNPTSSEATDPNHVYLSDQKSDGNERLNPYAASTQPGQGQAGQQRQTSKGARSSNQQHALTMPSDQAIGSGLSSATPPPGSTAIAMPNVVPPSSIDMSRLPRSTPSVSRELVRRQGTNWALPKSVAASSGNAIVRTIRVQSYPDRFVLLPPRGEGRIEMFGLSDGDINRATLELATAIRDRIVQWGAALPGGRWQPRLEIEIMPHGDRRFHQLRMLMSGSGVEVEGRPSR